MAVEMLIGLRRPQLVQQSMSRCGGGYLRGEGRESYINTIVISWYIWSHCSHLAARVRPANRGNFLCNNPPLRPSQQLSSQDEHPAIQLAPTQHQHRHHHLDPHLDWLQVLENV